MGKGNGQTRTCLGDWQETEIQCAAIPDEDWNRVR